MRPFFRALPPLAAVVLLASSVMAGPSIGSKAPDFTATAMSGKTFRLSQFRGKSPVIVNFFSTTWGVCREEYPHLSALERKLSSKGLKVVSVSVDDGSTAAVKKFVTQMKPAFTVVHDPTGKSAQAYGVSPIPANFVISRDGKILAVLGYDLPALQQAAVRATGGSAARASR